MGRLPSTPPWHFPSGGSPMCGSTWSSWSPSWRILPPTSPNILPRCSEKLNFPANMTREALQDASKACCQEGQKSKMLEKPRVFKCFLLSNQQTQIIQISIQIDPKSFAIEPKFFILPSWEPILPLPWRILVATCDQVGTLLGLIFSKALPNSVQRHHKSQ